MSDIRKQADEFADRLDAHIQASRQKRMTDSAALEASRLAQDAASSGSDITDRIRAYDEQLTYRIQETRQALEASLAKHGLQAPVAGQVELTTSPDLLQVDRQFLELFQIRKHIPAADIRYPTLFCETLNEFFAPLLESFDLSPMVKNNMLGAMKAEAEQTAHATQGGGVFGMNLPSQGCYLNGWLFNYGYSGRPRDRLRDPRALPKILCTAAHERLGHGFITEFTALGAEKKALGLQSLNYARQFHLKVADTPAQALLVEKHNLVHWASEFTEEGWATWVAEALLQSIWGQPRTPRYTLQSVWDAITHTPVSTSTRARLQSAIGDLFLEPKTDWEQLHSAVLTLQGFSEKEDRVLRTALDEHLSQTLGQSAPYVFGSLLMDKLESCLGVRAVPYAVMIAASVTYDLRQISSTDLARLIAAQPRLNPDSRLAALSTLELEQVNDVRALAVAARERLSLATPAELLA